MFGVLEIVVVAMLLAGAAVGLRAVLIVHRGRGPCCADCGYALAGVLDGETLRVERCPECGAALNRINAVADGQRRRPWGAIVLAGVLIVAGGLIWLGVRAWHRPAWNVHKPIAWLKLEAGLGGDQVAAAAAGELVARASVGSILNEEVLTLLPRAVEAHRDAHDAGTLPAPGWSGVVALAARTPGTLDAEGRRLLIDALVIPAPLGPDITIIAGDPLTQSMLRTDALIQIPAFRGGAGGLPIIIATLARLDEARLNDEPLETSRARIATYRAAGSRNNYATAFVPRGTADPGRQLKPITLSPGTHVVETDWTLPIWVGGPELADNANVARTDLRPPDHTISVTSRVRVEVVENVGDVVELVDRSSSPSRHPSLWLASRTHGIEGREGVWLKPEPSRQPGGLQFRLEIEQDTRGAGQPVVNSASEPAGVFARLSLEVDGKLYPIMNNARERATVAMPRFHQNAFVFGEVAELPRVDRATLVLTPYPRLSLRWSDGQTPAWNEMIRIQDIGIDWSRVDPDE